MAQPIKTHTQTHNRCGILTCTTCVFQLCISLPIVLSTFTWIYFVVVYVLTSTPFLCDLNLCVERAAGMFVPLMCDRWTPVGSVAASKTVMKRPLIPGLIPKYSWKQIAHVVCTDVKSMPTLFTAKCWKNWYGDKTIFLVESFQRLWPLWGKTAEYIVINSPVIMCGSLIDSLHFLWEQLTRHTWSHLTHHQTHTLYSALQKSAS